MQHARTGFAMVQLENDHIVTIGGYGRNGQTVILLRFSTPIPVCRASWRMNVARGGPELRCGVTAIVIVGGRSSE